MVEKFIKDDLMTFVLNSTAQRLNESDMSGFVEADDVLMDDEQLIEYFGKLYAKQPENFRFQPGDKMLIRELVGHVSSVVDANGINSGLANFKNKRQTKTKKNQKAKRPTKQSTKTTERSLNKIDTKSLKSDLIRRVVSCLYSHQANHLLDLDIDLERDIIVNVYIKNGIISGSVRCIICDSEKQAKNEPKLVHYSTGSNWPCWVLSNFANHLKKTHNLNYYQLEKKLTELPDKNENSTDCKTNELIDSFNVSILSKKSLECLNDSGENEQEESVVCLNDSVKITRKSSQHMEIVNSMYTQLSDQIRAMISAVLKNAESHEEMIFRLDDDAPKQLVVAKIPGDGNCLFSALTHQLENKRINGKNHQAATSKLRADVVKYILDNYSKFSHHLRNRVYELKERKGTLKNKAKIKTEDTENIDMECKLFVKLALSKTSTWGGAESIHAVSEMKQVNIVLFNENGPCYTLTNINANYERSICIAYRQAWNEDGEVNNTVRNHYDSVCDMDSNVLYDAAQMIISKQK